MPNHEENLCSIAFSNISDCVDSRLGMFCCWKKEGSETNMRKKLITFEEEWKRTKYVYLVLFFVLFLIGLTLVFIDFGLGALVTAFSLFVLGMFFAYEDVYRRNQHEEAH